MPEKYLPAERWNELLGITDSYQAPAAMWDLLKDRERREQLFKDLLIAHDFSLHYDWLHKYFQDEHADRKEKKQDFTPNSIGTLMARMVGAGSPSLDIAAGTGGLTIKKWYEDMRSCSPFEYRPSMFMYHAEELSSRTIPFLLFNFAIRGMNAAVVHCDTISRESWGAWFVQNDRDDYLGFSGIYSLPLNQDTADQLSVRWHKKAVFYPVDAVGEWPEYLGGAAAKEALVNGMAIKEPLGAVEPERPTVQGPDEAEQLSLF